MSLYKRFRGARTEPRGTIKEQDYYKSQYNFYFRTEAAMFGFIKRNDHQPPKIGMLSTKRKYNSWIFFIGKK
jgi:hypothetical protein